MLHSFGGFFVHLAQQGKLTFTFDQTDHSATMLFADDGVGFERTAPRLSSEHPGWGLIIIKERVAAVGGSLEVESGPAKGTRVVVEVGR